MSISPSPLIDPASDPFEGTDYRKVGKPLRNEQVLKLLDFGGALLGVSR
jgi:hypothetical protein